MDSGKTSLESSLMMDVYSPGKPTYRYITGFTIDVAEIY